MWEISIPFMESLATPQIMGSCLLTPKRKCFKVYYQYSFQSLGHLTRIKILDKPRICSRYSVLCFVNFFNPPSSNENKSILNFFHGLYLHKHWTPIIICLKMKMHLHYPSNKQ